MRQVEQCAACVSNRMSTPPDLATVWIAAFVEVQVHGPAALVAKLCPEHVRMAERIKQMMLSFVMAPETIGT